MWSLTPTKKRGGGGKSFSHAEGGAQKLFEVVLTRALEVLDIVMGGGHKRFPLFKRGGGCKKFYPVLGGGRNKFQTRDFPIL